MKPNLYKVQSESDPDCFFHVEANNPQEAAINALHELDYSISAEPDEEQMEYDEEVKEEIKYLGI